MMLSSQKIFLASLFGGCLLDFAAALPATDNSDNATVILEPIQFCNPLTEDCDTVTPGSTLSDCNPTDPSCEVDPVLQRRFKDGRTSCGGSGIFEFTSYQSSTCLSSRVIQVACVRNDQPGLARHRWITCGPTEICVQNDQNPSYAKCEDVIRLVLWKTAPNGKDSASRTIVANKKQKFTVGNNYYDKNNSPIQIRQTDFSANPGDINEGISWDANRAFSKVVDYSVISSVTTSVYTGGFGSIEVASFIF